MMEWKDFPSFHFLLILLCGTPALADCDNGLAAYDKGDYATALNKWIWLAEQGDASVQFSLGYRYDNGMGVIRNYDKDNFNWQDY